MNEVLTVKEVCSYLRLSLTSVYRLLRTNKIPCQKVGGQWRILKSQLEDYLKWR